MRWMVRGDIDGFFGLALDNLVVVPHLGSATVQTRNAMAQRSVDNLLAGLQGRELPSRVA